MRVASAHAVRDGIRVGLEQMTELALRAELAHAPVQEGEADPLLSRLSKCGMLRLLLRLLRTGCQLLQGGAQWRKRERGASRQLTQGRLLVLVALPLGRVLFGVDGALAAKR